MPVHRQIAKMTMMSVSEVIVARKLGPVAQVNAEFCSTICPELMSWGLSRNPNPKSCFGRAEFGFHYDFADMNDPKIVCLVSFGIIQNDASLWIAAYKFSPGGFIKKEDIPILSDSMPDLYRLSPRFSFRNILRGGFRLPRKVDDNKAEAAKLIAEVKAELPRLRKYLYG